MTLKFRFISRCSKNKRWIVNIPGQKIVSFADSNYFGKQQALNEAKWYRDDVLNSLLMSEDYLGNVRSNRNSSGIIGVGEYKNYILAWWSEKGTMKSKSFSIDKHGYEQAWEKALKVRFENIGFGGVIDPNIYVKKALDKIRGYNEGYAKEKG